MPGLFVALAIGFGIVSFVFPAFVARAIRRAEMQLKAIVHSRSYTHADLEPSRNQVQLTRFLGGWGVLVGLVLTFPVVRWPLSAYLLLGIVGYTVVFFAWLGYTSLWTNRKPAEPTLVH